jgi:hypothetical protein
MDEYTYVIIPAEQQRQIASCSVEEWRSFGCGLTVMVGLMVVSCGIFLYILITHHY